MAAVQQVLFGYGGGGSVLLPTNVIITTSALSYNNQPASSSARFEFKTNGVLEIVYSANGDEKSPLAPVTNTSVWLRGGRSDIFSIRVTVTAGGFNPFGVAPINEWVDITSNLTWGLDSNSNSTPGFRIINQGVEGIIEIAYATDRSTVIASCPFDLSTYAETQDALPD